MLCFSSEALRRASSKPGFIIPRRQDHLPHCFYCTARRIPRIVTSAHHALCSPGHSPNHQPPHHHGKVGNNNLHALSLRVDAELIIIIKKCLAFVWLLLTGQIERWQGTGCARGGVTHSKGHQAGTRTQHAHPTNWAKKHPGGGTASKETLIIFHMCGENAISVWWDDAYIN